ncbi:MAG: glutamate-1-semialdehyde 2,1-aminomutase [Nitrososphaeria archaeon]
MQFEGSKALYNRAQRVLVGGVNSPVRAFGSVGGNPIFIKKAKGSKIYDVDENEYVDYVCSWGAIILGHADEDVLQAVFEASKNGTSYGFTNLYEVELAEAINERIKSAEMVRFVNSGTEAAMTSLRLARGYTNRKKVIKFIGNYHGHYDPFLVKAGSGLATYSLSSSEGVTEGCIADTLIVDYNDVDSVVLAAEKNKNELAAIIVEPVAGNMGVIKPDLNFLKTLREICDKLDCVLIFDEVITGFRVSYGGAQELFGVLPDITLLGKIVGGGFPLAAVTGKKEIMKKLSPIGAVYQAGTLAGNPVATAAGLATLKKLTRDQYDKLEDYGKRLEKGINEILEESKLEAIVNRVGSMFSLFFNTSKVKKYSDIKSSKNFPKFFWKMIENKIFIPPSQYESLFFTLSHNKDDLEKTLEAFKSSVNALSHE